MTFKITWAAGTDVGLKRQHNEDAYGAEPDFGLYVVCDGMGGHASGEVASRLTVDHLTAFVVENSKANRDTLPYTVAPRASDEEAVLSNAIQFANDRVYVEGMKDAALEGMGTTVVAVLASETHFAVGHVGDSRLYAYTPTDGLRVVTRDHSLLNYKIDQGELKTREDIAAFRQGNIIVKAIGLKDYVRPEIQSIRRCPGELLLLCSDGLTDLISDGRIEATLQDMEGDMASTASRLIEMANDEGGRDNITVMLLRVDDEVLLDAEEDTLPAHVIFADEVTAPSGLEAMEEATDPLGTAVMDDTADAELEAIREADTLDDIPAVSQALTTSGTLPHARQRVQSTSEAHRLEPRRAGVDVRDEPSIIVDLSDE